MSDNATSPSATRKTVASRFRSITKTEITLFLLGIAAMHSIFLAAAFRGDSVDPARAGQFGDFVGGYVGTGIGLLSVLFFYRTLKTQNATLNNQIRDSDIQSFETKYFDLVKMHRDNVAELSLGGDSGRRAFVLIFRELRAAADIARRLAAGQGLAVSPKEIQHIAYYCIFFGTGPTSSRMLKGSLTEFNQDFIELLHAELTDVTVRRTVRREQRLKYVPFDGHQSRLGHYYRHLYQAIRYVDDHESFDKEKKYEYVKTLRAQLTNHEQALLLINSLTPMGEVWWDKEFIQTYRMVQNVPRDFFDATAELDLEPMFAFDSKYFEWQEVEEQRRVRTRTASS